MARERSAHAAVELIELAAVVKVRLLRLGQSVEDLLEREQLDRLEPRALLQQGSLN